VTYHVHDTLFVFWVAMFYMPLLPAAAIAAMLAFLTNIAYVKIRLLTKHKQPEHCDVPLWDTTARLLPWIIFTSTVMQLFYVRWSYWYMADLQKSGIPLRTNDSKTMEALSLWFFVALSIYVLLPVQRILNFARDCCKKDQLTPETHKVTNMSFIPEHYDSFNPLTSTKGRIRGLKEIVAQLQANQAEL